MACISVIYAQECAKDSLMNIWQDDTQTTDNRIKAAFTLLKEHTYGIPEETIGLSKALLDLAEPLKDYQTLARIRNIMARGYYFQGKTEESFKQLQQSVDYSLKANDIESVMLGKLNLVSFFKFTYLSQDACYKLLYEVDSLASHSKNWSYAADAKYTTVLIANDYKDYALSLKKVGELELLLNRSELEIDDNNGRLYFSAASIYKSLGNYQKAIDFYTKAINAVPESKAELKVIVYIKRGEVKLIKGDTLNAVSDFKASTNILPEDYTNSKTLAEENYGNGLYLYYTKEYSAAFKAFDKALEINEMSNRTSSVTYSLLYMSRIALQNKAYGQAIELCTKGLDYIKVSNYIEHKLEFLKNSYLAYKALGNINQALSFYEQYKALDDEFFNEEKAKALAKQEAENAFALERQETNLKYEANLKEEQDKRKRMIVYGLIVLVFVGLVFLAYMNQRKRKAAQREQELQEQYTHQLLDDIEEERGRIAGDLHDSVNHSLMQLKEKVNKSMPLSSTEISDVIAKVRHISHNLSPAMFEQIGLIKSIEELCRSLMETSSLKISHQLDYLQPLSKKQELQVYRIIEEAMTNIIKHSKATHAFLKLKSDDAGFALSVKDNGKGMSPQKEGQNTFSFGLHSIKQRSKAIRGIVSFTSTANGTEVNLRITA